jgi:hypothetical protein
MHTRAPRQRMGRPPGERYPKTRTIRLDDHDLQQLEWLRQRRGGTLCALLRYLVRQGLAEEAVTHEATRKVS